MSNMAERLQDGPQPEPDPKLKGTFVSANNETKHDAKPDLQSDSQHDFGIDFHKEAQNESQPERRNDLLNDLTNDKKPGFLSGLRTAIQHDETRDESLPKPIILTPSILPDSLVFDAKDSQFFKKFTSLPSPEEVRERGMAQWKNLRARKKPNDASEWTPWIRPSFSPVIFKELELLVKWGYRAHMSEGQCLWAIGKYLKGHVPVPELYGWRQEDDDGFIYMEYLPAETLETTWETMGPDERVPVCSELRTMIDSFRLLRQDPEERFVGSIARSRLSGDRSISRKFMREAGPFESVGKFHDWFAGLYRRGVTDHSVLKSDKAFRNELPDDCDIKFTHSDLHASNILITPKPYHVLAIIDWEQSGWMPEYWEAMGALYSAPKKADWAQKYLPMMMHQYRNVWESWDFFSRTMGPF